MLQIAGPPFSAGAWLTLTDPLQPFHILKSSHSTLGFSHVSQRCAESWEQSGMFEMMVTRDLGDPVQARRVVATGASSREVQGHRPPVGRARRPSQTCPRP